MSKDKKTTLRQRLRANAEKKLDEICTTMVTAGHRAVEESETELDARDIMHLLSVKQNKTLRDKLVTKLANEAEAKLEVFFNQQSGEMFPGDD